MRVRIHPRALKHGLNHDQILAAYESGRSGAVIRSRDRSHDPQRWALIGFDHTGRAIELVFVHLATNAVLIFHANYLTKGFLKEVHDEQRLR